MVKENKSLLIEKERKKLLESSAFLYNLVRPRFGSSTNNTNLKSTIPTALAPDIATGVAYLDSILKQSYKEYSNGCILSVILMHAIAQNACHALSSKISPLLLRKGIEKAIQSTILALENYKIPMQDPSDLLKIITYRTDGDEEIAKDVLKAVDGLEKDSNIIISRTDNEETKVQNIDGIIINEGFFSNHFAIDKDLLLSDLGHSNLLLVDEKIESVQSLLSILKNQTTSSMPLLIFAKDFADDVTATLLANRKEGLLDVVTLKLPKDLREIETIASLSGATIIAKNRGVSLTSCGSEVLGRVQRAVIDRKSTTLIDGRKKTCYIRVGKDRACNFEKYKQALVAAFTAKKEGVVPGSTSALIFASSKISAEKNAPLEDKIAVQIVEEACRMPLFTLAENLGLEPSIIINEVIAKGSPFGLNIKSEKVENLQKIGAVEGYAKLVKALENASLTTSAILSADKLIVEKKK